MNFDELNNRLEGVISDLRGDAYAKVMVKLATNAIALIGQRVQESGTDASGSKYRDYTDAYKRHKQKAGKYKGFVDFTYSGRMWNNTTLVSDQSEHESGVARIAPQGADNREKMQKNVDRRGRILELSPSEIDTVRDIYDQQVIEIFRKNGL